MIRALTIRTIAMTLGAPFGLLLGDLLVNLTGRHSIFVFDLAAFAVILALNDLFLPGDKNPSCEILHRQYLFFQQFSPLLDFLFSQLVSSTHRFRFLVRMLGV